MLCLRYLSLHCNQRLVLLLNCCYTYTAHAFTLSLSLYSNLLKRKQSEGKMVLLGGNLNLSLATQSTSLVNSIPIAFTVANVPILLATLATNIWAIQIIQRKETSRINRFFSIKIRILTKKNFNRQFCNVHCPFKVDHVGLLDEYTDHDPGHICTFSLVHSQVNHRKSSFAKKPHKQPEQSSFAKK